MRELKLPAKPENLYAVLDFVDAVLDGHGCDETVRMTLDIAVEEMYVNIAHYAYAPGEGDALIRCEVAGAPPTAMIQLVDTGKAFNPLARPDPDLTLSAADRGIGGLGIYMVKTSMDRVAYVRQDGQNIFTMWKAIHA
jgi:anti-sigma regulatory factor (Ser/Thr protein kinase)